MMEITDWRFRYFMRLINRDVRLYTEMVVAHAIVRGDYKRLLKFDTSEHPVVLQLGGNNAQILSEAAKLGEDFGYDAIDLNCGCPSGRVESGEFGVTLMREEELVAEIISRMHSRLKIPVSVKCRIGITGEESEEKLIRFVKKVKDAGASRVTIHARTATLGGVARKGNANINIQGLSPKENREIPPLNYNLVYRVKKLFPNFSIEINGGVKTKDAIESHLQNVDRVMLGRLAHENPFFFSDGRLSRKEILEAVASFAEANGNGGISAARFFTNMLNLFHSLPGARKIRRFLSEEGRHLSPIEAIRKLQNAAGVILE
ncbi:MAG: tRNA-dihydrouridine(20/20a) synthase [Turneriella sp.]|nr:tRNA-dihydrouridine(20/20a) synthase [Turneriella sp.]